MPDQLAVYVYNVLFGDGILVEIPDGGRKRFILIDVGNVVAGRGGLDRPLLDTIDDVIERTGGHVDLYVMTHEHYDHVQGLLYAADRGRRLQIDTVWMTAPAEPGYFDRHPEAGRMRAELVQAVRAFEEVLGAAALPAGYELMFALNVAHSTRDHVDHIRGLTAAPHYLHRDSDLRGKHPFEETGLRILAPVEDVRHYLAPLRAHLTLGDGASPRTAGGAGGAAAREPAGEGRRRRAAPYVPVPPPGIDGSAFYGLIASMNGGLAESLLQLDKADNNASLVLEITWRGRRLLFTGDAEQESWRLMVQGSGLAPVDVLKVSHHGSRTGRPPESALEQVLPRSRRRTAVAVLSTHATTQWKGVPDADTIAELEARTKRLYRTDEDAPPGKPVIVTLKPRRGA